MKKTIAILKRKEKLKSVRINQGLICFYSTPILAMMKTNLTRAEKSDNDLDILPLNFDK